MEYERIEWRPIPNFPNYEMNASGDIVNLRTGNTVAPMMQDGRAYVQLFRSGRRFKRSWRKLISATFPVRREAEVFEDWVEIPGFEDYEIGRSGIVRRASTGRLLRVGTDSGDYVQLTKYGKTYKRSIKGLMRLVGYRYIS